VLSIRGSDAIEHDLWAADGRVSIIPTFALDAVGRATYRIDCQKRVGVWAPQRKSRVMRGVRGSRVALLRCERQPGSAPYVSSVPVTCRQAW